MPERVLVEPAEDRLPIRVRTGVGTSRDAKGSFTTSAAHTQITRARAKHARVRSQGDASTRRRERDQTEDSYEQCTRENPSVVHGSSSVDDRRQATLEKIAYPSDTYACPRIGPPCDQGSRRHVNNATPALDINRLALGTSACIMDASGPRKYLRGLSPV